MTKAVTTTVEDDSSIDFAQSNYVVSESICVLQVELRRNGSTASTASVKLNISSGTAIAGLDCLKPTSPTVTFADGEYGKLVDIAILDDTLTESDENFTCPSRTPPAPNSAATSTATPKSWRAIGCHGVGSRFLRSRWPWATMSAENLFRANF